ncbi:MAG TPA: PQQ-binding-like beta-propeller repeat protein [Pirellulaceae bacterium]|nr:PQQ-binding-like beta-propeller repeat protein [Pirellulaceae bacterium]
MNGVESERREISRDNCQLSADWPMWGRTVHRNMVAESMGELSLDFDLRTGQNVKWSRKIGSQSYGNPIVADGKVLIATNNGESLRPQHVGDRGVLLCFNADSGELLWQLTREKLAAGPSQDWPDQGICSNPCVEGNRLWVVTNRCELMCLDINGFHDGTNDGTVQNETSSELLDADIIWTLDMIEELGVFPRNMSTSSPLVVGDLVFVLTSNGRGDDDELPSPDAPSFVAVNKQTGRVVWTSSAPGHNILHGQWGSPCAGEVNGQWQVVFPGGDGWVYAFDATTGEEIWRFDCNPKEAPWEPHGRGVRSDIVATPVFYEQSVIVAVGQDPEHGEGVGPLWRIDATSRGDISGELGAWFERGEPNPNSGVLWHYGGWDDDGSVTGIEGEMIFRRTISTVAVADGLVFIPDISGYFHCVDVENGSRVWMEDLMDQIWGSPAVAGGLVWLGSLDGKLRVFKVGREPELVKEFDTDNYNAIYSGPTFVGGAMYLADRTQLYKVHVAGTDTHAGK